MIFCSASALDLCLIKFCALQCITIDSFIACGTFKPPTRRAKDPSASTAKSALGNGVANQHSRFSTAMGTRATHARASANSFPLWNRHSDRRQSESDLQTMKEPGLGCAFMFRISVQIIVRGFFTYMASSTSLSSHQQILQRSSSHQQKRSTSLKEVTNISCTLWLFTVLNSAPLSSACLLAN